jgi:hypothetical protein
MGQSDERIVVLGHVAHDPLSTSSQSVPISGGRCTSALSPSRMRRRASA